MEALHDSTEYLLPHTEQQGRALRKAIAMRKLEKMREEKALHWFISDVWDEPANTSPEGRLAQTDDSGVNHDARKH
jgi:hypothetical protein